MKKITVYVPEGTQLLHLLAVIDKGIETYYETRFCDLRNGGTEYKFNSCYEENEEGE